MTPLQTVAKAQARAKREGLELAMLLQLRGLQLDRGMVREHPFDPLRKWRFDFAWPDDRRIALEVEGGTMGGKSRHTTGTGFEKDCEKYALAAIQGWRVIRATGSQVKSGVAAQWVALALGIDA